MQRSHRKVAELETVQRALGVTEGSTEEADGHGVLGGALAVVRAALVIPPLSMFCEGLWCVSPTRDALLTPTGAPGAADDADETPSALSWAGAGRGRPRAQDGAQGA
jgi:hypothetical protein